MQSIPITHSLRFAYSRVKNDLTFSDDYVDRKRSSDYY